MSAGHTTEFSSTRCHKKVTVGLATGNVDIEYSLRSRRYCVGARLKFWRRSSVPKKGSGDEAVEIPEIIQH